MNERSAEPPAVAAVTLYTGRGCHLCEEARWLLEAVRARVPFVLREVRIDGQAELEERYRSELPVVELDGTKLFKYRVDPAALERALRARRRVGDGPV
ncbi:MAG TPA: glutaredoxin family protein [Candidatus Krumholzibacteria bacterium]